VVAETFKQTNDKSTESKQDALKSETTVEVKQQNPAKEEKKDANQAKETSDDSDANNK
jgi:hypothetical protein